MLSTCTVMAKSIAKAVRNEGEHVLTWKTQTKMLGDGTACGLRRCACVQHQLLQDAKAKRGRVAMLRSAGVNTAAWQRVAGNAAMAYGCDAIGVADSVLDKQRSSASATASAPGGGNRRISIYGLRMLMALQLTLCSLRTRCRSRPSQVLRGKVGWGLISPLLPRRPERHSPAGLRC